MNYKTKQKYKIVCPICKSVRDVAYAQWWTIDRNKRTAKCRKCSALSSKFNGGRFEKGQTSWLKGTKGIVKPNSGSFGNRKFIHPHKGTEGVMRSNKTSFKDGISPWNKGTKGICKAWNKGLGISTEERRMRMSDKYKEWRMKVLKRDNFTCLSCKQRGEKLHAHHIDSFAKFSEYRFDISNGVTLCKSCHLFLHSK